MPSEIEAPGSNQPERINIPGLGTFEVIPGEKIEEFLGAEQNIYEQPPFAWLFLNQMIFPSGFFTEDKGEHLMMRVLENFDPKATMIRYHRFSQASVYVDGEIVNRMGYKTKRDALIKTARQAWQYLEIYPYWKRYLKEQEGLFTEDGCRINCYSGSTVRIKTYAAFADACLVFESGQRWIGLGEELPDATAAENIYSSVAPGKRKVNRVFRMFCKSEAVR